jgi:hypothetical protein
MKRKHDHPRPTSQSLEGDHMAMQHDPLRLWAVQRFLIGTALLLLGLVAAPAAQAQGPGGMTITSTATQGQPATLTVWATDDNVRKRENEGRQGPAVGLVWSKFRGPGAVRFGSAEPKIQDGRGTTTVTFDSPGEYVLRVLAWDASGSQGTIMAGGFQCCWTNGYVRVNVGGGAPPRR